MPKFTPKAKKKEKEKQAPRPPEEKPTPPPSDEELERLRELERKFGKIGGVETAKEGKKEEKRPWGGQEKVWEKIENSKRGEQGKTSDNRERIIRHEAIRHSRPSEGMIGPGDPDYISPEKLEKRKRELAMTEARLRTLEREEQDINKRLEYLRKEHSAMEMAIKEKTYLEREIAELREDRDRIKSKLDELKETEGQLEQKSWEELKRSPAIGARISALERRIHELEGQIIELNEQRLRAGSAPLETPEPKPAPQPKVEKPVTPAPRPEPTPAPQPKQEEKKPPVKKKKSRLTF
ncbi:MAG: hypothetical protein U9Q76_03385 [candidate division WOR-3 bacterium]|jgi:DNA repair exonuclease SbcCD ATPase subunit|nr:hypothetical protein [candidate division WOR-3 bacterium]